MHNPLFTRTVLVTTVLALFVVVLGAFVRLSDAGLGCPDWPGCYGKLTVPAVEKTLSETQQAYPERVFESHKAWKEMLHRYVAGTLGLLILLIAILAFRNRADPAQPVALPVFLVGLLIFQALLGMWTVTLLLKPVIVMAHLLGGLATLSLLWWLYLRSRPARAPTPGTDRLRSWAWAGLVVVVFQIALGGWTSANYAALACPDFPTCQTHWWPPTDFVEAFTLWRGTGVDYEFGVLDNTGRVTVHLTHRLGAVVTFLFIGALALRALFGRFPDSVRRGGAVLLALLLLQVSLGIGNVLLSLPLPVAVAHNGVAALLLLAMVTLLHFITARSERVYG
jgi:cytochrome c oxidase assembly protein subunit 15